MTWFFIILPTQRPLSLSSASILPQPRYLDAFQPGIPRVIPSSEGGPIGLPLCYLIGLIWAAEVTWRRARSSLLRSKRPGIFLSCWHTGASVSHSAENGNSKLKAEHNGEDNRQVCDAPTRRKVDLCRILLSRTTYPVVVAGGDIKGQAGGK